MENMGMIYKPQALRIKRNGDPEQLAKDRKKLYRWVQSISQG